jgi:hypothetical protein
VPYNSLSTAAARGTTGVSAMLLQAAFGASPPRLDDDLLTQAHWAHTDSLHLQLEPTAGHKDYLNTRTEGHPGLDRLLRDAAQNPRQVRDGIVCKGEKLFRDSFLAGGELDLGGCAVSVVPERTGAPIPRLDLGDLRMAPGGGGVLYAPEVILRSLKNGNQGAAFAPLVLIAGRLELTGPGPYEGCLLLQDSLALTGETTPVVVRGLLYDTRGGLLQNLTKPMAVVFEPRQDPMGSGAAEHYRSLLLYGAGPRIFGMGGTLVDASTYRRPPAKTP